MPAKDASKAATPQLSYERDDDFIARYANNIHLESSGWDLKITFGVLDQRDLAKPVIEQHTSINMAWSQVKIMLYFMQMHLRLQEEENGKIKIPESGLPLELPAEVPKEFDNPQGRRAFQIMREMRADFIAKLNEP